MLYQRENGSSDAAPLPARSTYLHLEFTRPAWVQLATLIYGICYAKASLPILEMRLILSLS